MSITKIIFDWSHMATTDNERTANQIRSVFTNTCYQFMFEITDKMNYRNLSRSNCTTGNNRLACHLYTGT